MVPEIDSNCIGSGELSERVWSAKGRGSSLRPGLTAHLDRVGTVTDEDIEALLPSRVRVRKHADR